MKYFIVRISEQVFQFKNDVKTVKVALICDISPTWAYIKKWIENAIKTLVSKCSWQIYIPRI